MALLKDVTVEPMAIVAAYWRITSAEVIHADVPAVHVRLAGYVNQAAREAGAAPCADRFFRLLVADFAGLADLHDVSTAMIYDAVKARVSAAVPEPVTTAPLSPSDATSSARAPAVPDPLAGAADA